MMPSVISVLLLEFKRAKPLQVQCQKILRLSRFCYIGDAQAPALGGIMQPEFLLNCLFQYDIPPHLKIYIPFAQRGSRPSDEIPGLRGESGLVADVEPDSPGV